MIRKNTLGLLTSLTLLGLVGLDVTGNTARADQSAVGIMYHRFGDNDYPSTNVRMEQFLSHLDYLRDNNFTIWPLEKIIQAMESQETIPDKTVAVSIDDAFLSVFENAWPLLKDRNIPVTLFVSSEPIDRGLPDYMTWDQIREMQAGGVHIGGHSHRHTHLPDLSPDEFKHEISYSLDRLTTELGQRPTLFAYPFGETSKAIMDAVKDAGYKAGFGQHSGAMSDHGRRFYLPRFPINEAYGGMDRFARVVSAKAPALADPTPTDPFLGQIEGDNPPAIGFTFKDVSKTAKAQLTCYQSGAGKIEQVQWLGDRRVEIRFDQAFKPGRTRVNCTYPAGDGRWFWHGLQFYVKSKG